MMYLLSLLALLIPVVVVQLRWAYRRRQLMMGTWKNVLTGIQKVDLEGIKAIAECYLQPDKDQLRIEPGEMWQIVGGLEGLERLKGNAEAMLNLAIYSERWNRGDGPVVSEMIRHDGMRLNRAVRQIQVRYLFGFGIVRTTFYLQDAVASYYLIRSRLLGQYQNTHVGLIPGLEAAL
jgi:hypothetical protein